MALGIGVKLYYIRTDVARQRSFKELHFNHVFDVLDCKYSIGLMGCLGESAYIEREVFLPEALMGRSRTDHQTSGVVALESFKIVKASVKL